MKQILLPILMSMLTSVATAQNSEPKYIEAYKEVTDTAKAMQMAEAKKEELKEKIIEDKAIVENESKYIALPSQGVCPRVRLI